MEAFAQAGVTNPSEINKITHENALQWYGYDPFAVISKTDATVGALRAHATDVDTSIRSRAEFRKMFQAAS